MLVRVPWKIENEFDNEHVRAVIAPRVLDVASREEHVGPVERSIRTAKERVRCICHSLPYKRYTKIMVRSLVEIVVFWLNSFPVVDGVSEDLSPAAIVHDTLKRSYRSVLISRGK